MIKIVLLISITLISFVFSHPTYYSRRNETCYNPVPADIYSWHVHVLYWQTNENHTNGAMQLREKFVEKFGQLLGPDCNSTFHMDHMCLFPVVDKADGPFLTAQWAIFLPIEKFYETVAWFMQNRGIYDVLVHPNTGCEIEDHSWWAFWGGKPWEINFDAFSYDYPFPWTKEMEDIADPVLLSDDSEESLLAKTFLKEHPEH